MTATQQSIARHVGVSRTTVSRVLGGNLPDGFSVTPELQERIHQAARELGYRPNSAARAAKTGRFDAAALIARAEEVDFFPYSLVRGISDELARHDKHMIFARIPKSRIDDGTQSPKIVRELSVDGMLIHEAVDVAPAVTEMVRRHHIPAVWINTQTPGDCVYPDEHSAVQSMLDTLIRLGHRRIAFFESAINWERRTRTSGPTHYSSDARREAYRHLMARAGLEPMLDTKSYLADIDSPFPWGKPDDDRLARAIALLKRPGRPTAVVCPDLDSVGPVLHAAAGAGLRMPQDLSVISIHSEAITQIGQSVSVALIPLYTCGVRAVQMLEKKIEQPAMQMPREAIPYDPPVGATHGPAPRRKP